jgi:hypothetical protein
MKVEYLDIYASVQLQGVDVGKQAIEEVATQLSRDAGLLVRSRNDDSIGFYFSTT